MNAAGETVRELTYYPFGLVNAELSSADTTGYDFLFTGKEWIDQLGIDLYDYGARYLDPELGRWGAVDPMAEKYVNHSPYNGILNNPFNGVDLFGMDVAVLGNGDISITGDDVGRYLMFLEQLGIQGRSLSYADELLQISLGFGYIPNDVYIALDGGFEIYSLIDVTCTGKNRGGGSTNRNQNLAGDWGGGRNNEGNGDARALTLTGLSLLATYSHEGVKMFQLGNEAVRTAAIRNGFPTNTIDDIMRTTRHLKSTFKVASRGFVVAGVVVSAIDGVKAYNQGDMAAATMAGMDIVAGLGAAAVGGPVGLMLYGGYLLIMHTEPHAPPINISDPMSPWNMMPHVDNTYVAPMY